MKKYFLLIICLFIGLSPVSAKRYKVTLNKCVDGDTAYFNLNNEIIKTRFLAINTPESTTKKEAYGKEASDYTCSRLKNSNNIEIEYDSKSDKFDKYDRHLVWVFIDDNLLQEELVSNGLAEVKYVYGKYKYLDHLYEVEDEAREAKKNIWSDVNSSDDLLYNVIFFVLIVGIIVIFKPNKKDTKKLIKMYKKRMK